MSYARWKVEEGSSSAIVYLLKIGLGLAILFWPIAVFGWIGIPLNIIWILCLVWIHHWTA